VINGTDPIRVLPVARGVAEIYEPETWPRVMVSVGQGDVAVDVGAFIGLYTVALAKRVGSAGKVIAFEPDPENFAILKRHVELNGVGDRVELYQAAVSDRDGKVLFSVGRSIEGHIIPAPEHAGRTVRCVRLDAVLAGRRVDVLKIDVEGHELSVLQGASTLLHDAARAPLRIFIEVHPYTWAQPEAISASLLHALQDAAYRVLTLQGTPVDRILEYGEVVALAPSAAPHEPVVSPPVASSPRRETTMDGNA
jgi:FkbM family methyltransferase